MPKLLLLLFLNLLFASCFISCNSINTNQQEIYKRKMEEPNPYVAYDKSPMDISYYPPNYPLLKMSGSNSDILAIRLIYSRPQKNGRVIFGNQAPPQNVQQYGTYWRMGANEATEIEFFKPVYIKGQKIEKGRYTIYCIPYQDKWNIVFNTGLFSWGLHTDTTKDIAKVEIPAFKTKKNVEYFTMVFQPAPSGAKLIMAWDDIEAVLPISF